MNFIHIIHFIYHKNNDTVRPDLSFYRRYLRLYYGQAFMSNTVSVKRIRFTARHLGIEFKGGLVLALPLKWFPELDCATIADLKNNKITSAGIEWLNLKFTLDIDDILKCATEAAIP